MPRRARRRRRQAGPKTLQVGVRLPTEGPASRRSCRGPQLAWRRTVYQSRRQDVPDRSGDGVGLHGCPDHGQPVEGGGDRLSPEALGGRHPQGHGRSPPARRWRDRSRHRIWSGGIGPGLPLVAEDGNARMGPVVVTRSTTATMSRRSVHAEVRWRRRGCRADVTSRSHRGRRADVGPTIRWVPVEEATFGEG